MASLYETYAPEREARRIAKRLEFHHTRQAWELAESCPELAEGMAEIEFRVLARACLRGGRNPDESSLRKTPSAPVSQKRNAVMASTINWRFTTKDARAQTPPSLPLTLQL